MYFIIKKVPKLPKHSSLYTWDIKNTRYLCEDGSWSLYKNKRLKVFDGNRMDAFAEAVRARYEYTNPKEDIFIRPVEVATDENGCFLRTLGDFY